MHALGADFKMPARQPTDPEPREMRVSRIGEHHLHIRISESQDMIVSEYTAARMVATLSLFLGLRFVKRHAERLTL